MPKSGKKVKEAQVAERVVVKTKDEELMQQQTYRGSVPARVVEIVGRVGVRGEATQIRCKVLDGYDKGKIMRRNVRGPIRIDDILMLKETELEAAPLGGGRR